MSEIKKVEGDKKSDPLSSFMKKQMVEKAQQVRLTKDPFITTTAKSVDKSLKKDLTKDIKKDAKDAKDGDKKDDGKEEEMTEEEKELEEVKKASRNKAAERDQSEMYKKMIKEAIVKYTILLSILGLFAIAVIKAGPALVKFLNGGISRALMSAIGQ